MNKYLNIEKYLNEKGKLTYTFRGVSMEPMLTQGKDLYTVVKKTKKRCDKYDVVLYRKSDKQYALHRIIKVREKDYVIQGDNCISKEYGIADKDIVGVMTSFTHKGKVVKVSDLRYKIYINLWTLIHPFINIVKLVLINGRM